MALLSVVGHIGSSQTMLDHGITDLVVLETDFGAVLYTTSGQAGGVAAYTIDPDGSVTLADMAYFGDSWNGDAFSDLSLIETGAGPQLVVADDGQGDLVTLSLGPTGMFGDTRNMSGTDGTGYGILDVDQSGSDLVFVSMTGDTAIHCYAMDADGTLTTQMSVGDTEITYARDVFAIETVSIHGIDYLIGASQSEQGVSAFRIDDTGLSATASMGIEEGLGIMTPTDMQVVEVEGRSFVLVASSPGDGIGQSGALTVLELTETGDLLPTDHVIDTLHTRFGTVQSLDVIEANGRTFVVAGGGDDGLTLFCLLPNGRLQVLDVMADSFTAGLENVSSIAAYHQTDTLHLFVSSEISPGVTEVTVDTSQIGATVMAEHDGGQAIGTALDDILLGGDGNDEILAGAGDDIIEDGAGRDTLSGGAGQDIFILRSDGEVDAISDFDWTRDRLDLSDWPFFYDPSQLTITSTATGAIVTWRGEYLEITSHNGTSLTALQIMSTVIDAPNRPPGLDMIGTGDDARLVEGDGDANDFYGGSGSDTMFGYSGNDTLRAQEGDDLLYGGDGNDRLLAGDGNDTLRGGQGGDRLEGQEGHDILDGEDGRDFLLGGAGRDTLSGGLGDDYLYGEAGSDKLYGEDGDDKLYGEDGNDLLDGGAGADLVLGGSGHDRLLGGDGADTLTGGAGRDRLNGGNDADSLDGSNGRDDLRGMSGDDTLIGGGGRDQLEGNSGSDLLQGGRGNDRLYGGNDADTLEGGGQNDSLSGEGGNDALNGDNGNDTLSGDAGDDTLSGGNGADLLTGGGGRDSLFGEHGADTLHGDSGHDALSGGQGYDLLYGGRGHDTLEGDAGNDTLFGGSGNDHLFGDNGHDVLDGGSNRDQMSGGDGRDHLQGGTGDDTLLGDAGHDTLDGGDQDDIVDGGSGRDTVMGGSGNDRVGGGSGTDAVEGNAGDDTLFGGAGDDTLNGGAGNDRLSGGNDADELTGGSGDDQLWGGAGADLFVFADGHGNDTIRDFEATGLGDRIDLSGVTGLTSADDLFGPSGAATQVGTDVLIATGVGQAIWLLGVDLSDLDASDFQF